MLVLARPLYSYIAAIPEELGFGKKDLLAILYKQDDGWWEAEVVRDEERFRGLAPSNYLEEIFVVSKSDDGGLPSKLESAMIEERAKSKRKSVTFADRSDDSAGSWTSNSYK